MKYYIYLDHAAATPVDKTVLSLMQPYFSEKFYNPSATYLAAQAVHKDLQAARGQVAQVLGAKPAEIIFTSGGTEANNLAVAGIMQQFPEGNIAVSTIEHESVLAPANRYNVKLAPVTPDGIVDVTALTKLIDDKTVLVSTMYANNEIGTIQPIRRIAQELEKIRSKRRTAHNKLPLYFHTDAAQAANYLDLHVARLGVDLMTLNGGKIYGPKQSGVLYVSSRVYLEPQILGGGQERGLRSGTENVAGSLGFAAALTAVQSKHHKETKRLGLLQQEFFTLLAEQLPTAHINGSVKHRLPNNVHITIPGQDNERLLIQLDEAGILAAAGSACSASDEEPSHVLTAMGLSEAAAQASLRFTMGQGTNQDIVKTTVAALADFISAN